LVQKSSDLSAWFAATEAALAHHHAVTAATGAFTSEQEHNASISNKRKTAETQVEQCAAVVETNKEEEKRLKHALVELVDTYKKASKQLKAQIVDNDKTGQPANERLKRARLDLAGANSTTPQNTAQRALDDAKAQQQKGLQEVLRAQAANPLFNV